MFPINHQSVRRIIIRTLADLLLFLGLLSAGLYLMQPRMVFMPSRAIAQTPADWGLAYEDLWLRTKDGVNLHAWYLPHPGARQVLLFFHGNAGNISHRRASLAIFHRLGLAVLILDYRGYGRSQGRPSEAGLYQDAAAAWDYLVGTRGIAGTTTSSPMPWAGESTTRPAPQRPSRTSSGITTAASCSARAMSRDWHNSSHRWMAQPAALIRAKIAAPTQDRRFPMAFTQGHALLIGVGTYAQEPHMNVPITAADAQALAGVLRDPAFCGYPDDQVAVLHDATASRVGILAALDALGARAGAADTVLLYFCGHGDYGDDGDYYLTTHDTRLNGSKVASGSGLRQGELIARLRAIAAKRLLLVVNACHAGALAPTLGPAAAPDIGTPLPAQTAAALLATGEGRIIITACREDQRSYIGTGALTLFTQALVDGLQGRGTSSSRGFVSAYDLYTHLYFTIKEAVRRQHGATQEPELTVLKGVGPFAVALYRGATVLGDFDGTAQPPAGLAVREVDPAYARALLGQHSRDSYQANLTGSGAIAQGPGATAVGAGGVLVHGGNSGTINTGPQVNTGGGAHIGGNVSVGGDFVGRDKIT